MGTGAGNSITEIMFKRYKLTAMQCECVCVYVCVSHTCGHVCVCARVSESNQNRAEKRVWKGLCLLGGVCCVVWRGVRMAHAHNSGGYEHKFACTYLQTNHLISLFHFGG